MVNGKYSNENSPQITLKGKGSNAINGLVGNRDTRGPGWHAESKLRSGNVTSDAKIKLRYDYKIVCKFHLQRPYVAHF